MALDAIATEILSLFQSSLILTYRSAFNKIVVDMEGCLAEPLASTNTRTHQEIDAPPEWVERLVGGNGIPANLIASVVGALFYFATLTEVPILRTFLDAGMGNGPALALLLAGPALSLPNMLVLRSIMGTQKTLTFIALVVVMAMVTGYVFGLLV